MGDVSWLEQSAGDVRPDDVWLTNYERCVLNTLRFPKRRADWRLGRWTAKCAISLYANFQYRLEAFQKIEIRAASSGAPVAYIGDRLSSLTISISHRGDTAICGVGDHELEMGCDLELIETRSAAFLADYFTPQEQEQFANTSFVKMPLLSAILWSAKESTLKAVRTGLRLDTRCVGVDPLADAVATRGWLPLRIRYTGYRSVGERLFEGWWQPVGSTVRTFVADRLPNPPMCIAVPATCTKGW